MAGIETDDRCPRCGAPVRWRLSVEGTRLRLDVKPDPKGTVIVVEVGGKIRARVLDGKEMPAQQEAFKLHGCTSTGPPPPKCAVCRGPMMPAEFFRKMKLTTHPGVGCDSAYQAEESLIRAGLKEAT